MNQDNRILIRKGARILTRQEMEHTSGGIQLHTETVCTVLNLQGGLDGDRGECGF